MALFHAFDVGLLFDLIHKGVCEVGGELAHPVPFKLLLDGIVALRDTLQRLLDKVVLFDWLRVICHYELFEIKY